MSFSCIEDMRKARKLQDGARYHVTARANRKELVMGSTRMKDMFLETVERAKKRFKFRIDNFCVMGNHFHLMIQPLKGESLSRIMQWIMSVFAMKWNRIHNAWGHVWGGRFFSRIIAGFKEFMSVFRYIDANSVEAQLTECETQWEHGGLWHRRQGWNHLLEDPPDLIGLIAPSHRRLPLG